MELSRKETTRDASPLNPPILGDFDSDPPELGGRGAAWDNLSWKSPMSTVSVFRPIEAASVGTP